jgi:serine protease Do
MRLNMSTDNHIWTLAEAFVSGTLPDAEYEALQARIQTDTEFAAAFHESVNLIRSLNGAGKQARFKSMLQEVHAAHTENKQSTPRTIPLRTHYLRTAAVAAGIALVTSFTTYWGFNNNNKKSNSQYNVLRRDIENIKRSQNALINDINQKNTPPPSAPVKYTGTGFAITNDGYFTTSCHVTDGADSVYIQNHDGDYFKASVVAYDQQTDIAILKVDDEDFRFSKTEVPYTFSASKVGLGSKVYTLGFPEDEIIYNEGYVSAKNGFQDDSMQYRLELPADPGQSGAPVLDAHGNVLAIVTAKGSQSEGNTYAVSSKALLQLLHKIPGVHLSKTNRLGNLDREQQIGKLEYYTCSVKVYKK